MNIEDERLLLAGSDRDSYANAFIYKYLIVTAGHVAIDGLPIQTPNKRETGSFTFQKVNARDLALSKQPVPTLGFAEVVTPQIGEEVWVHGHHGPNQEPFVIDALVESFTSVGRIIIKRKTGKKFQLGMSGCPVIDSQNRLVGVLVEGVSGTGGEKVYLEPAIVL
jgi:hypothetical protein